MRELLKSRKWIRAALLRAARTSLVTLASYTTLGGGIGEVNWGLALSATALATILSLVTSLGNLPEVEGKSESKLVAVLSRGIRSFFQNALAFIPSSAVLLSDVDFAQMISVSGLAAVGSLLLGIVSQLPEEESLEI